MKIFAEETIGPDAPADAAAAQLCLETGVRIVRLVRRAVREAPPSALSLSRLRALAFIDEKPRACLSELAEHLIVGPPTASKVVDDLVARRLVRRAAQSADRRRVTLELTAAGRRTLRTAARPGRDQIAALLARLSPGELRRVRLGMETLLPLLVAARADAAHD